MPVRYTALWYTSRAEDLSANVPELVQILDTFNTQVDNIAAPYLPRVLARAQ
jgi:hypothetical protein